MNLFDHPTPTDRPDHFLRVVIERGIEGTLGTDGLTYASAHGQVGQWVTVPLGRRERPVGGVVVATGGRELLDGLDPDKIKRVIEHGRVVLTPDLVALAQWISRYYVCPLGLVVKAMLPGAVKSGVGQRTQTVITRPDRDADAATPELSPSAASAWRAIAALPADAFPIEPRALALRVGQRSVAPINRLIAAGLLASHDRTRVSARDERWMTESCACSPPPQPTCEQQRIIEGVAETLGTHAVHLLRGVTGSGKTEVYLRLISKILSEGRSAIVLVPEIALTPQTVRRFAERFDHDKIAVLHSQLTDAQRHRAWESCAEGRARVLIGPRSAVLAPMTDLGLIVVDEEHDSSYKQDAAPRYHGRDVAVMRGHMESVPVLLASATPSLESWHNATGPNARYTLWTLAQRVGGSDLPPVRIIDLAAEQRARRENQPSARSDIDLIGPTLEGALRATLARGSQAILLLNRRGEAGYVGCASSACGWSMRCSSCDVSLTAHRFPTTARSGRYLRCHHCLAAQTIPSACPLCQRTLVLLHPGTQHVEAELEARLGLVANVDFVRVDSDSMRSGDNYFDVLDRFGSGQLRVLLGTQMIAKGLDFPNVGLVGVLNADTALMLPDFRSQERTFQLVSQVAGRAGRGDPAVFGQASVLVQTMHPLDPAICFAAAHDYESFAQSELAIRRSAQWPPCTRMARIVARHASLETARQLADAAAQSLRSAMDVLGSSGIELRGPMPCSISRINDRFRFEIHIIASRARALMDLLDAARRSASLTSDAEYAIDVDPVSLL